MKYANFWRGAIIAAAFISTAAWGQAWRPDKPVEIIVPTGAGGINDQNARLIQKSLQEMKLPQPVLTVNKPGGNQSLAVVYLQQHAADPHYMLYATATVFTNQLAGLSPNRYSDMTPLALLLVDYSVISVAADSPIKTMRELVDRLKADPDSVAFGLVSRGGPNHLALAQGVRSGGADAKRLKLVVFKTNAESITAVMGGHIHAVVSSVSAALPQALAGRTRIIAVAAPQRVGGNMANVPTMREQGIDATGISNWRGLFAPRGVAAAQAAYWEEALTKVVATEEWKKQLDDNNLVSRFLRGKEFAKYLDGEYADTRSVMSDLGLIKQ